MNLSTPMDDGCRWTRSSSAGSGRSRASTGPDRSLTKRRHMATKTVVLLGREALDRIHARVAEDPRERRRARGERGMPRDPAARRRQGRRPDGRRAAAGRHGRGGHGAGHQDVRPGASRRAALHDSRRQAARRRAREDAEGAGLRGDGVPAAPPAGRHRPLPHHERSAGRRVHASPSSTRAATCRPRSTSPTVSAWCSPSPGA